MCLVDQEHIQTYLPQHPPFLMVDTLETIDNKSAESTFKILSDNILLEGAALFTEAGMIENIAQTAALQAGYHFSTPSSTDKASVSTQAPVGYIGALKDFQIFHQPKVGDVLHTTIIIEHQIGHASVIKGEIKIGTQVAATGELKIFLRVF